MKKLAVRAGIVAPSLTLAITAQANKLKAQGVDIVGFTAGEPDFRTPEGGIGQRLHEIYSRFRYGRTQKSRVQQA